MVKMLKESLRVRLLIIACNIFLPKGEKLSENTLKTGEIQLAEEIRLEIAENIQKIRILKWKDTN